MNTANAATFLQPFMGAADMENMRRVNVAFNVFRRTRHHIHQRVKANEGILSANSFVELPKCIQNKIWGYVKPHPPTPKKNTFLPLLRPCHHPQGVMHNPYGVPMHTYAGKRMVCSNSMPGRILHERDPNRSLAHCFDCHQLARLQKKFTTKKTKEVEIKLWNAVRATDDRHWSAVETPETNGSDLQGQDRSEHLRKPQKHLGRISPQKRNWLILQEYGLKALKPYIERRRKERRRGEKNRLRAEQKHQEELERKWRENPARQIDEEHQKLLDEMQGGPDWRTEEKLSAHFWEGVKRDRLAFLKRRDQQLENEKAGIFEEPEIEEVELDEVHISEKGESESMNIKSQRSLILRPQILLQTSKCRIGDGVKRPRGRPRKTLMVKPIKEDPNHLSIQGSREISKSKFMELSIEPSLILKMESPEEEQRKESMKQELEQSKLRPSASKSKPGSALFPGLVDY